MQDNISQEGRTVYSKNHIDNKSVYIPNELVEAELQYTLDEYRVSLFIFSLIQKEKEYIHIQKNDIFSFIQHYTLLSKVLQELQQKSIILENQESIHVIDEIEYSNSRNILVKINQKLYHLFQQSNYTSVDLATVLKFKHKHSIKLYQMIARYKDTGWRRDTIEDFKRKLSLQSKYNKFKDMKKRVLEPAIEEIERHTNMKIRYEFRKTYVHFVFENQEKKEIKKKEYIEKLFDQEFISYLQEDHHIKNPIGAFKKMSKDDIELNIRHFIKHTLKDIPDGAKATITKLAKQNIYAAFLYVRRPDQREKILSALSGGQNDIR